MITTVSVPGSEIASMIPRWYSAREVRHWPGSALASELSRRFRSAQSLIVSSGGGRRTASARVTVRLRVRLGLLDWRDMGLREIVEHLADGGADLAPGLSDRGLLVNDRSEPVRQGNKSGTQEREHRDP